MADNEFGAKFEYTDPKIEESEEYKREYFDSLKDTILFTAFGEDYTKYNSEQIRNMVDEMRGEPLRATSYPAVKKVVAKLSLATTPEELMAVAQEEQIAITDEELKLARESALQDLLDESPGMEPDKPIN